MSKRKQYTGIRKVIDDIYLKLRTIRRILDETYWFIFGNFWHKLGRSFSWFFFMWGNNEWDYSYIYKVLHKRIKEFRIHTNKYHRHESAPETIKDMDRCLWLLDRLIKVDACDKLYDLHTEKFGRITIDSTPHKDDPRLAAVVFGYEKCDTEEKYAYAPKVSHRIHDMEERLYEKYKEELFKILNDKINYWWD